MSRILENLNKEQLEAVKHFEGPLLVMAGAGSGKTKVLTHRIAYLIEEKDISANSILAITFTNKAAKEMKSRVIGLIGDKGKEMHISTFHSFCVYILRQDIDQIGYKSNFVIYDENDVLSMMKKVMSDLNIDTKMEPPKKIKSIISKYKNDYLFPSDIKKMISDEYSEMVYKIYMKYQEDLQKANALDFDDLIMLGIRLLERDKDLLSHYQKKFQFILVDEYQDTNKPQFKLIKMLSDKHHNIFAVGDLDQSIYSWRGADIRNITQFERDFMNDKVKSKTIFLEQNYRSYQNILDVANSIIKKNHRGESRIKQLWSEKKDDRRQVVYYRAVSSDIELEYIAQKILEKCKTDNYEFNDFAILYRTNALSLGLEKILTKYRIDYVVYGNVGFFERKEIKDLVAYLRLIVNHQDDVSFLRVVNEPRRGIGDSTLEQLKRYAMEANCSLYEATKQISTLSPRAKQSLLQFVDIIDSLRSQLVDIDINIFIDNVLKESNYLPSLESEKTEEASARIENLKEFKTLTLDIEEDINENDININVLTSFDKLCLILNNVTLASEKKVTKDNAVKLMTIHAAKGLEFPVVFIYGVEENIFPLGGENNLPEELEEERRLMYVAITRAETELFITNSETRKLYGGYRVNPESRFIGEIDHDLLSYQGVKKSKKIEKVVSYSFEYDRPKIEPSIVLEKKSNDKDILVGSKIIHTRFGEGVVVRVDGDICTIAFGPSHGIKKLDINHPAITILK